MAITRAMLPCFKEEESGEFIPEATFEQKRLQLSGLAGAIFQTQNFCMWQIEGQTLRGVDFLPRTASHYGVYLEFYPDDFTLGAHLDKVAGGFRKHDLFHMGKNEAARRLRNSYSVITDISSFLQNLRLPKLRGGGTVYLARVRDALLILMEHRPDVHTGRISLKLSDNLAERAITPLMNLGEIR